MGPKPRQDAAEQDLFRKELVNLIDQRHELVKLAALIDWPAFEQACWAGQQVRLAAGRRSPLATSWISRRARPG